MIFIIALLLFICQHVSTDWSSCDTEETDDFNKVQQLFKNDPEPKVKVPWLAAKEMCDRGAQAFGEPKLKLYARQLTNADKVHKIMEHFVRFEYRSDDALKIIGERHLKSRQNTELKGKEKMKISDEGNDTNQSNFREYTQKHDGRKNPVKELKRHFLMGITKSFVAVCKEVIGDNYYGISLASPKPNRGKCYYILSPALDVIESEKQYITIEDSNFDVHGYKHRTSPIIEAPQFIPKAKKCLDPRDDEKPTRRRKERSPTKIQKVAPTWDSVSYQYEPWESYLTRVSVDNFFDSMLPASHSKLSSESRENLKKFTNSSENYVKQLPETCFKKRVQSQELERNNSNDLPTNNDYLPSHSHSSTVLALKVNELPSEGASTSKDHYPSNNTSSKKSPSKPSSSKKLSSKELNLNEFDSDPYSLKANKLPSNNEASSSNDYYPSKKAPSKELSLKPLSSKEVHSEKISSKLNEFPSNNEASSSNDYYYQSKSTSSKEPSSKPSSSKELYSKNLNLKKSLVESSFEANELPSNNEVSSSMNYHPPKNTSSKESPLKPSSSKESFLKANEVSSSKDYHLSKNTSSKAPSKPSSLKESPLKANELSSNEALTDYNPSKNTSMKEPSTIPSSSKELSPKGNDSKELYLEKPTLKKLSSNGPPSSKELRFEQFYIKELSSKKTYSIATRGNSCCFFCITCCIAANLLAWAFSYIIWALFRGPYHAR